MKRILTLILLATVCSYSVAYAQDDKKKTPANQENVKKDSTLGDHYRQLGKDIKTTSKETWKETKKVSGEAWENTKEATGETLDKVGKWTEKTSKKLKGKK